MAFVVLKDAPCQLCARINTGPNYQRLTRLSRRTPRSVGKVLAEPGAHAR